MSFRKIELISLDSDTEDVKPQINIVKKENVKKDVYTPNTKIPENFLKMIEDMVNKILNKTKIINKPKTKRLNTQTIIKPKQKVIKTKQKTYKRKSKNNKCIKWIKI